MYEDRMRLMCERLTTMAMASCVNKSQLYTSH